MSTVQHCPICDSDDIFPFYKASNVPAHIGLQWPTEAAARSCPKGDIRLIFCRQCGHIYNSLFDQECIRYTQDYENSLHHSTQFQTYTDSVVRRLVDRYDLRGKTVVEIGCGKGDFLIQLARAGKNRAIGFDPIYEERPLPQNVTFVQDFYSANYAGYHPDFVCSRYVYEHVPNSIDFLEIVRRSINGSPDTAVYFEVPNVKFILRDLSVWDIIYEHCAYFSDSSLAFAFQRCDFHVTDVAESYDGQFIGIEARTGRQNGHVRWGDVDRMEADVTAFAENYKRALDHWRVQLCRFRRAGKKCVLWGAGGKAVSFLNMLNVADEISFVVDINPRKWGTHIAGTGHKIVSPEFLTEYEPNAVIVMNPIYREEIGRTTEQLGLNVEFHYASRAHPQRRAFP